MVLKFVFAIVFVSLTSSADVILVANDQIKVPAESTHIILTTEEQTNLWGMKCTLKFAPQGNERTIFKGTRFTVKSEGTTEVYTFATQPLEDLKEDIEDTYGLKADPKLDTQEKFLDYLVKTFNPRFDRNSKVLKVTYDVMSEKGTPCKIRCTNAFPFNVNIRAIDRSKILIINPEF